MKTHHFLLILISAWACKSVKTTQGSIDVIPVDTVAKDVTVDTIFLVTQKGDTLSGLDEEIEITMDRLLPDTVTIAAVGDIMIGTNFPNKSYLPDNDGSYLWRDVQPFLQNANITFGNLEGTILDEGGEQKECNNPKLCYLFRSPEYLARNFTANGFDLMSVANNHANDFGETGRKNTQRVLDSLGIAHAGSVDQPFTIAKIGRLKIGFCAFAPNRGTVSIHQYENIKSIIQHLDSLTDIVVASFHAGAEGSKHQHVTRKREYYYGEDRGNVYELAHLMIDNGADIILGHGPHIVRAIEVYKERIIAYSLGNFLTYGRFNLRGLAGEAPLLIVKTDATGRFMTGQIHAFRQSYSLGPRNDLNLSSIKTIQRLSLEDFPENPVTIDDEGRIIYLDK
ncbi:capsule synthesis protein PGA_cap [Ekhidna lutea]|uniref:Capsule synthesis protein PGA_cap n=1 Tax=Ekhidna lutea TaxID=447679 RepID=A0A239MAC2_EKHLU|nr:CapA family protein [Ekhidna lutea]SNT38988.1 capsule synthesis protein PGA_cap [Ekhidna lutea]